MTSLTVDCLTRQEIDATLMVFTMHLFCHHLPSLIFCCWDDSPNRVHTYSIAASVHPSTRFILLCFMTLFDLETTTIHLLYPRWSVKRNVSAPGSPSQETFAKQAHISVGLVGWPCGLYIAIVRQTTCARIRTYLRSQESTHLPLVIQRIFSNNIQYSNISHLCLFFTSVNPQPQTLVGASMLFPVS